MEKRRVAIETVVVDFCPRVHIGTRFDRRRAALKFPYSAATCSRDTPSSEVNAKPSGPVLQ